MSLRDAYHRLVRTAGRVDAHRAQAIVAEATPHAVATLGRPVETVLPVSTTTVAPEVARGGSIIPAWPIRQADGSVVIEHVEDWGALLAGMLAATGAEQADPEVLAQRVWIGIANDVLQLFVADPPPGTYSMVRHHALMLAAATAWLGPAPIRTWQAVHVAAGAAFVRSCGRPLHAAIQVAEQGLQTLLDDDRAHQPASRTVAWLDGDPVAGKRYINYLGAASLGVAAVLGAMPDSDLDRADWFTQAVMDLHANPDFNRAWIEECAFACGGTSG